MKALLLTLILAACQLHAQTDPMEGLWQGYEGEWVHASRQIVALAEAIPEELYAWRPAPGVRSTSEVIMHIAQGNYFLLSTTGLKRPADLPAGNLEKAVTAKADVIARLKQSLDAVKSAYADIKPAGLKREAELEKRKTTVGGIYLRILVHANEHMGQLVAYARFNHIVPPWSEPAK